VVLGFVGRIVRDKGIEELAQAWCAVRDEHPEARLLVVGPFEPQDPVAPETEALLRSDPRIHLTGMDWNTPPLYAAMDALVLPTYREGFPNTPLEAAAMGLPVIATRIPGCVDAVADGLTGTLVPPADAHALADAMRKYLANPALRRAHGVAGQERIRLSFRQEVIWGELFALYVRLLQRQKLPAPRAPRRESIDPALEGAGGA
jgi:glycosyltransferase involved in cell wall biosynthesis